MSTLRDLIDADDLPDLSTFTTEVDKKFIAKQEKDKEYIKLQKQKSILISDSKKQKNNRINKCHK
jgi:hypothetical protein